MSIKTDRPNNIWLKCPYCGLVHPIAINPCKGDITPQMVTCPSDNGGCDKVYAVKITLVPTIEVYRLEAVEASA